MRPVDRGPVPQDAAGQARTVAAYADWRADLLARLGKYCSYCEMPLYDSPQVEHVAPKSVFPARRLDWTNMLLACGPCNRAKSDTDCPPTTHFLPDTHNTLLAFTTQLVPVPRAAPRVACVVVAAPGLTAAQAPKAAATIGLCALDKILVNPRATDMRWQYRLEASLRVQRVRALWNTVPPAVEAAFVTVLLEAAISTGFFSLWFAAFADVLPVKQALLNAFPGTALTCFDAATGYAPTIRVAGDL